jgi:hypothetical protein
MVNKKYPYIQFSSWTVQCCQKIGYRSFFIKTCRRSNNTQVQKHPKRARASLMARLSRDRLEVGHRRLFLFPVLGSIELGDRVGTQFKDSVPDTSLSYSRERTDPCTMTWVPFKSVLAYSASLPKLTTRCQSVRLCHSSLSFFHVSFVATDKVVTAVVLANIRRGSESVTNE